MKTGGLTPYILVSFLIHTGILYGTHQFLKLPAEELESVKLIAVEMVVLREESPDSEPELAPGEDIRPESNLQVKSQIMTKTATGPSDDRIATPLPRAEEAQPSVTLAGIPATAFIAEAPAGANAGSRTRLSTSQIASAQLSPVSPSRPAASARLAVKMPEVLVEARAELRPVDSGKPEKVAAPLPGNRPAIEPVFEMMPTASESRDEPRLTLGADLMPRDVPRVPEAETIGGKPVILISRLSPLRLSPADPSTPPGSTLLDVKMSADLIHAKAAATPAHPRPLQKIETRLTSPTHREDPAVERKPPPREGPYEPVLMVSTLQLSSHPSGAQVYVDGVMSGVTPLDMELPLGKHEVRLALPEYYDWKAQIELTEKHQALPIFFRLLPVE